jgi:hypothetical protein
MAMEWFLPIVLGCLIWAYLSVAFNRRNIAEFERKTRKAGRLSSRALNHPFRN